MDADSLEIMLESFDTIPGLVLNYLQDPDPSDEQTIMLVVSDSWELLLCFHVDLYFSMSYLMQVTKCFAVLLRCLGHRFWNHHLSTPDLVLNLVMQHCRRSSWRVFVTKQFIELLPPLLLAMRPPQVSSQAVSSTDYPLLCCK